MKSLKTSEVAKLLDISLDTARVLGDEGIIKSYRTEGKHRRYCVDSVQAYRDSLLRTADRKTIIYTHREVDGNNSLNKVFKLCEQLGWNCQVMKEDSSDEFENSSMKKLIGYIEKEEIARIIIDSEDNIYEKHFNFVKEICHYHDVQVIVISEMERGLDAGCLMNL